MIILTVINMIPFSSICDVRQDSNIESKIVELLKERKTASFAEISNSLSINKDSLLIILKRMELEGKVKRKDVSKPLANGFIMTSEFYLADK